MRTFYEFFAGGGMVRAGLQLGWDCAFANDFSEKKGNAYRANWGDEHLKVKNIGDVKLDELPGQADLAWASFPCQDLSLAGNGVGLAGKRSGTFWDFWKLMQALNKERRKPSVIALENVYGAITSHGGKDFEAIAEAIISEGYRLGAMVIDAVHFVPQSRPRLFIVAVDATVIVPGQLLANVPALPWHPPAIEKAFEQLPEELQRHWNWWNLPVPPVHQKKLKDIIDAEPQGVQWHTNEETTRLRAMMTPINQQKVEQAIKRAKLTGETVVGSIYRRTREGKQRAEVRFDDVSGCLRTPSGGSSRQTIVVVDGTTVRSRLLSPREAARLMGLDEDYKLPERYNDAYHLASDGVAVPVVVHLAQHILNPIVDALQSVGLISKAA